jgi:hypothetical protein
MDDSFYTLYTYAIQDKYRQSNGKMNTNLLLQAGRLENESNQMVILAVNLGLRNRCRVKGGSIAGGRRERIGLA